MPSDWSSRAASRCSTSSWVWLLLSAICCAETMASWAFSVNLFMLIGCHPLGLWSWSWTGPLVFCGLLAVCRAQLGQFLEELVLFVREALRQDHPYLGQQVPAFLWRGRQLGKALDP